MERLRKIAEIERRSLNQQAILILERALATQRSTFSEAYEAFTASTGPSPLAPSDLDGLRTTEEGRPVEL